MVSNGRTRITNVPFDANPSELGMWTVLFARSNACWISLLAEQFFALTAVDRDASPTPEQLAQLKQRLKGVSSPALLGPSEFKNGATWSELETYALGDLGIFLQAGFLPVLSDKPVTRSTLPEDVAWGYLIDRDSREVVAYRMRSYAGMEPYAIKIPLEDLSKLAPMELFDLPYEVRSELDDDDGPDRQVANAHMLRAVLDEERVEIRREREERERKNRE